MRSRQPSTTFAAEGDPIVALVRNSAYMFKGRITHTRAATMPGVPITDSTAIVRVEEILQAPRTLEAHRGREITILLQQPLPTGQRAAFFTRPAIFGASLAVAEVGHLPANTDSGELRQRITAALQIIADERLSRLLAEAELVVVGSVTETDLPIEERQPDIISFHDPLWRAAIIAVDRILKGDGLGEPVPAHALAAAHAIRVNYASSPDLRWSASPKFPLKQEGVWMLHRNQAPPLFRIEGLSALDPLDYQPLAQVEHIERLLAASGASQRGGDR
jgi:hypothetical protein